MIFPKKPQVLYAPMLGTLGGGSLRSFGRGASEENFYINHGSGAPTWSSTPTTYTVASILGHYGMGSDQFGRYLIIASRGTQGSGQYHITIPITETGLRPSGNGEVSNKRSLNFPFNNPGNSFGAALDTVNSIVWTNRYGTSVIARSTLNHSYNATVDDPAGTYPSGNRTMANAGSNALGKNDNDALFLDYINGKALYGGRTSRTLYSSDYDFSTGAATWTNETSKTLSNANGFSGIYGIARDFSSGYYVSVQRDGNVYVFPEDGSSNTAIARGHGMNEDVAIGWTGDLFLFRSAPTNTGIAIWHYART